MNATNKLDDWDLIVAVLHHSGVVNQALSPNMVEQAWSQGDGYGKMSRDELKQLGLMCDWSHIRDSSPEALVMIAGLIRRALGSRGLETVALAIAAAGGTTRAL